MYNIDIVTYTSKLDKICYIINDKQSSHDASFPALTPFDETSPLDDTPTDKESKQISDERLENKTKNKVVTAIKSSSNSRSRSSSSDSDGSSSGSIK